MTKKAVKTSKYFVRLTPEDRTRVETLAAKVGLSSPEYLRHLLWREMGKPNALEKR